LLIKELEYELEKAKESILEHEQEMQIMSKVI